MTNRAATFRLLLAFALMVSAVLACACGRPAALRELQRSDVGDLTVVLLSPRDAIHHGRDDFVLEFRSRASGQLVDVGDVQRKRHDAHAWESDVRIDWYQAD